MKRSLSIIIILFISLSFYSQSNELYHRARVYYSSHDDLQLLNQLGLEVDHGKHKKGVFIESDFSEKELSRVEDAGFTTEIIISNITQYYLKRNKDSKDLSTNKNNSCSNDVISYTTPDNFELGSMGGFFTYEEILENLDNMADQYPSLITTKAPISDFETYEQRPIFWVKMSDNVETEEDEPQMLYTAVHHAREPASVSTLIFYMWYLLENYEDNTEIQAILNNTELFFVPVVNPDGYSYNVSSNPNGGGLWRKNRIDHGNGDYGVDNNRNYSIQWGTTGVSSDTDSDVYPGTEAFSEVENQAVKWFCENHNFLIAFNNHSYSNLLLFPFGYANNQPTPEHDIYTVISEEMVSQNNYSNILAAELYPASGDSDDWMYIATPEKARIFAFTPEIGSSDQGFWPTSNDIIPLCNNTMYMNLTAAHMITKYATIMDQAPTVFESASGNIPFSLTRLGLQESDFTVSISPISNNITFTETADINGLDIVETAVGNIPYTLSSDITEGDEISYQYSINNGDYSSYSIIINKTYGSQNTIYSGNTNNSDELIDWESNQWEVTTNTYFSSPSSITDSPSGDYDNGINYTITLNDPINLVGATVAYLNFQAKWDIEAGYDYVQVEISTNGSSWIPQCGNYTVLGNSDQDDGQPLYHGTQNDWVSESINLSDYLDEEIFIRFQIVSDGFVTGDGFYFDDLTVDAIGITVGIDDLNSTNQPQVYVYPNPTEDITRIYYSFSTQQATHISIKNVLGQEVYSTKLISNEDHVEINLSNYPEGTYIYEITNNDKIILFSDKITVVR